MSESDKGYGQKAREILNEIGKKFEGLFHEFEDAADNADVELSELVKDLSGEIKTLEDKLKEVRKENDEVFEEFQKKMSDLSKSIADALDNAFSNRGKT